jgi:hypothetical protein
VNDPEPSGTIERQRNRDALPNPIDEMDAASEALGELLHGVITGVVRAQDPPGDEADDPKAMFDAVYQRILRDKQTRREPTRD